ncbi:LOW QUALITY PROTEIN: UVSSA isoform 1, partial [Pongo abelii]
MHEPSLCQFGEPACSHVDAECPPAHTCRCGVPACSPCRCGVPACSHVPMWSARLLTRADVECPPAQRADAECPPAHTCRCGVPACSQCRCGVPACSHKALAWWLCRFPVLPAESDAVTVHCTHGGFLIRFYVKDPFYISLHLEIKW